MQLFSSVSPIARTGFIKCGVLGMLLLTAACAPAPGPSVPQQPGKSIQDANAAFQICAPQGPVGARDHLTANYIVSVLWGGVIVGPLTVAATAEEIRDIGARNAIDHCLEEQGYERRELSVEELAYLNQANGYERELFLNHLVAGGDLASFTQELSGY